MADNDMRNSFYFDKLRSAVCAEGGAYSDKVVIEGYAVDGFLEQITPRAAIFVNGLPVKELKCEMLPIKLPPIRMRRRHGETISYLGVFFVDLKDITPKSLGSAPEKARLVLIGETADKERVMLYKTNFKHVFNTLKNFLCNIDVAYTQEDRTYIKGWMAGSDKTKITVGEKDASSSLDYQIEFIPRDDVQISFPECPEDIEMGFELSVPGEYKRLRLTMKEGKRETTQNVIVGKQEDEFDGSKIISRYSEKVVRNLRNYGVRETASKIKIRLSSSYMNLQRHYNKWIKNASPDAAELAEQRKKQKKFKYRPKLSILVPLYETEEQFLVELIKAIQDQTYPEWELCFSDGSPDSTRLKALVGKYMKKDERIKYIATTGPLGISSNTNQAFTIATGDFIVLGDHDDLIWPDAFYSCIEKLNEEGNEDADVIYTDEDKINSAGKKRFEPNIKQDFNQELFESCNYITHMFVARKSLVDEVGLFDDTYNGAQDYDFILRCTEKSRKTLHVQRIVYSWRINSTSTAGNPAAKMYAYDAGVKALQAHYDRVGIKGVAEVGDHLGYYHTKYEIPVGFRVSVCVVNADDEEKYNKTVDSIRTKSNYKPLDFIRITAKDAEGYGAQCNFAVKKNAELGNPYMMIIDAGVTMMGEDGISDMLGYLANRPEAACAGGKIYCGNGTIVHSGVVLEKENINGWMYIRQSIYDEMYFNACAYSALNRGVILFRVSDLEKNGKFDESFKGGYGMIDYTYRMTRLGRKCIYNTNAMFNAAPPRGKDALECFETKSLFTKEKRFFRAKHPEVVKNGDVYYTDIVKDEKEEQK